MFTYINAFSSYMRIHEYTKAARHSEKLLARLQHYWNLAVWHKNPATLFFYGIDQLFHSVHWEWWNRFLSMQHLTHLQKSLKCHNNKQGKGIAHSGQWDTEPVLLLHWSLNCPPPRVVYTRTANCLENGFNTSLVWYSFIFIKRHHLMPIFFTLESNKTERVKKKILVKHSN